MGDLRLKEGGEGYIVQMIWWRSFCAYVHLHDESLPEGVSLLVGETD